MPTNSIDKIADIPPTLLEYLLMYPTDAHNETLTKGDIG